MIYEHRKDLPPMPEHIRRLPVDKRGYPTPWFVDYLPNGEPEFRAMDLKKLTRAVRENRCWTCGDILGQYKSFVIGPMCAVNRISAEPPSHFDCAEWSARACPFLAIPKKVRSERNLPETGLRDPAGVMIRRNPGVALVWTIKDRYGMMRVPNGVLFKIGEPHQLHFFCEGRRATHAEIMESIDSGLPLLQKECQNENELAKLWKMYQEALVLIPA